MEAAEATTREGGGEASGAGSGTEVNPTMKERSMGLKLHVLVDNMYAGDFEVGGNEKWADIVTCILEKFSEEGNATVELMGACSSPRPENTVDDLKIRANQSVFVRTQKTEEGRGKQPKGGIQKGPVEEESFASPSGLDGEVEPEEKNQEPSPPLADRVCLRCSHCLKEACGRCMPCQTGGKCFQKVSQKWNDVCVSGKKRKLVTKC